MFLKYLKLIGFTAASAYGSFVIAETKKIDIPVSSGENWQVLKYSSIPANEVSFGTEGLAISVDKSASPIIYPLASPLNIKSIRIAGTVSNLITMSDTATQGEKGNDDFVIRVGLVIKGDKKLNWFQKKIAPEWVNTLYALAPKSTGIDHILFLNATQHHNLVGARRVHPLTDLIKEQFVWSHSSNGEFLFEVDLPEAKDVLAIWLSSDGDDTSSTYNLTYRKIEVQTL